MQCVKAMYQCISSCGASCWNRIDYEVPDSSVKQEVDAAADNVVENENVDSDGVVVGKSFGTSSEGIPIKVM